MKDACIVFETDMKIVGSAITTEGYFDIIVFFDELFEWSNDFAYHFIFVSRVARHRELCMMYIFSGMIQEFCQDIDSSRLRNEIFVGELLAIEYDLACDIIQYYSRKMKSFEFSIWENFFPTSRFTQKYGAGFILVSKMCVADELMNMRSERSSAISS